MSVQAVTVSQLNRYVNCLLYTSTPQTAAAENADEETARYEEKLRERVLAIVSQIDGVGEAHVSVTLDSGIEYVYAKEEKQDTDTRDGASGSTTTRASSEDKLIIVEDENGRKTCLLYTSGGLRYWER